MNGNTFYETNPSKFQTVLQAPKNQKMSIIENSITFYFKDDRMPNPGHLARRLISIRFNRENSQCIEYLGNYEFWNSESHLNRMLKDILYLRRYCKQRGLFLKEVVLNSPLEQFTSVLTEFAKKNNGFLTQTWKNIKPQLSRVIGYNLPPKPSTQIHVKWDSGSTLSLIHGEDKFEVMEE